MVSVDRGLAFPITGFVLFLRGEKGRWRMRLRVLRMSVQAFCAVVCLSGAVASASEGDVSKTVLLCTLLLLLKRDLDSLPKEADHD